MKIIAANPRANFDYQFNNKFEPRDTQHLYHTHKEWTEADRNLKMDSQIKLSQPKSPEWEGIYLSPLHPEVNQYLYSIVKEILDNYKVDGIHFDYIRYQDEYYGFHPDGRKEFNLLFDIDPLDIARGIISTRYGWEESYVDSINIEWNRFKQNKITELLEFINEDIIFKGNIGRIRDVKIQPNTGKLFFLSDDGYLWKMEKK